MYENGVVCQMVISGDGLNLHFALPGILIEAIAHHQPFGHPLGTTRVLADVRWAIANYWAPFNRDCQQDGPWAALRTRLMTPCLSLES